MPHFSMKSMTILGTCHRDIQTVMQEAIKVVDFSVFSGHRTPKEQAKLFAQGRTTKGDIITYRDGTDKKSKHNYSPSKAVDIIPWPEGWKDEERFSYVAGVVMTVAHRLWSEGKIENKIEWGGDWRNFKDKPHFQI